MNVYHEQVYVRLVRSVVELLSFFTFKNSSADVSINVLMRVYWLFKRAV